jgi:hypothetical protein
MTHNQNSRKPLVTDLWLLVDEEQTMHFGMRQAWRWSEIEQPVRHRLTSPAAVAHTDSAHPPAWCQSVQMVCAV